VILAQSPVQKTTPDGSGPKAPYGALGQAPMQLLPHTAVPAELSKSVDAKKSKVGDKVEAKTTMDLLSHGQIVMSRDTKIFGHVTVAEVRHNGFSASRLGIAFDWILMKDGRELPFQASLQAIGPPLQNVLPLEGSPASGLSATMPRAGSSSGGDLQGTARWRHSTTPSQHCRIGINQCAKPVQQGRGWHLGCSVKHFAARFCGQLKPEKCPFGRGNAVDSANPVAYRLGRGAYPCPLSLRAGWASSLGASAERGTKDAAQIGR